MSVVAVAQLVESRIVIPVVVGSSPISHPKEFKQQKVWSSGVVRNHNAVFVFASRFSAQCGLPTSVESRLIVSAHQRNGQ
jgi:hypothetical protein